MYNKFKIRKVEQEMRLETLPKVTKALEDMRDELAVILAAKPWITQDEGSDVTKKLGEMRVWLSEQIDL